MVGRQFGLTLIRVHASNYEVQVDFSSCKTMHIDATSIHILFVLTPAPNSICLEYFLSNNGDM